MTAETPSIAHVEAIYTFDRDMPGMDVDTGLAHLGDQSMAHFTVPVVDGELSEAAVLFALLQQLSAHERQRLIKVSLCFAMGGETGKALAPWVNHQDSPLFNGKLWLKQHLCQQAGA